MIRRKVLVACGDDNLAFAILRALYVHNASVDVLLAANDDIAQEIAEEQEIDVLVTDRLLRPPEMQELVPWFVRETPATHLLFLCDPVQKDAVMIRQCAGLLHWQAPDTPPDRIASRIADLLRSESHFLHGSLTTLSVADLVQVACLNRRAMAIRVRDANEHGTIFVRGGEVCHAIWQDGLSGEDAFYRLLHLQHGEFTTLSMLDETPRTIRRQWQELLLEGMRRLDEAVHLSGGAHSTDDGIDAWLDSRTPIPHRRRPAPTYLVSRNAESPTLPASTERASGTAQMSSLETEVARLIDHGFSKLRAGDHEGAKRAWESASQHDPGNRAIQLNLRKLSRHVPDPETTF